MVTALYLWYAFAAPYIYTDLNHNHYAKREIASKFLERWPILALVAPKNLDALPEVQARLEYVRSYYANVPSVSTIRTFSDERVPQDHELKDRWEEYEWILERWNKVVGADSIVPSKRQYSNVIGFLFNVHATEKELFEAIQYDWTRMQLARLGYLPYSWDVSEVEVPGPDDKFYTLLCRYLNGVPKHLRLPGFRTAHASVLGGSCCD